MTTASRSTASPAKKSINTVLFGALGLMALLFVASIMWKGKTSYEAYSAAVGQKSFDEGANRFIKGLFEVLM